MARWLALLVPVLALLAGCSSFRTFQGSARPDGGYDGAGGGDQIYFELRNVDGLGGPLAALVLPKDWPEREVLVDADGTARLVPPVEPSWRFGSNIDPPIRFSVFEGEGGGLRILATDGIPLQVRVVEERSRIARGRKGVARRLGVGASAYTLLDASTDRDEAQRITRYVLFGARLTDADEVQWVELCELELGDGRGAITRGLDVVLRQSRALEITFLAVIVTLPIWIWFVV
ncbi:MAG: hypothetical protein AAGB93_18760 [Planctomycetota bacterium]